MANRLSILNDPPRVLPGPQLLHKLINFEKHHNSCAIDFTSNEKRGTYSYQELRDCTDVLVARIQQILDAKSGQSQSQQHVIPILLPQSPGLYISQLAILESGGAFCPINLDAPKDRIKFVVGDVSADIIITTLEFRDSVSWEGGPIIILVEEFPIKPPKPASKSRGAQAQSFDLAYVMYTSGSSGTPKGVAVSHLAASQSLLAHEKHIPHFKRFLQFAAPSFDVSVFEIFFPFKRGSTLVGCERSQLLNNLPWMINDLEVDAAELTPTVVGALVQKRSNVPGLKLLLTIGEMLTRPIVEEFGGSESQSNMLYGMYGPTEAAIHCTIYPKMEANAKPGNIGIPLDTVSVFVAAATSTNLSEDLKFLPVGELGELVLGGPQLAQGYLNRPDQTKAAFVRSGGEDYYRTGDKARLLEDGTIEILGRISAGQVKLRGQRVELGEIEDAVYKHGGIKMVSAMVLSGSLIVFALVESPEIKSRDVLKSCAKWLPGFMVPSDIVLLPNFPYLPSGKVDKKMLESEYHKLQEASQTDDEEPGSATNGIVKDVLQSILGPIPSRTRLAAAGLDSLVAIRVASKLRSSGFNVTTFAVLQADTIQALTEICDASEQFQPPTSETTSKDEHTLGFHNWDVENIEAVLACTPLQSAMLSETALNQRAYRNWVEIELRGAEDLDQVFSALSELADNNAILRTGFSETNDSQGFVQFVWKRLAASQIEEVNSFTYNFDLRDASLDHPIRIQLLFEDKGAKILIHLHHALYDGWSLELLLDDLDAILAGQAPKTRPPFAVIVDEFSRGTLIPNPWASKDYWKDHLADLDLRRMPNFHSKKAPPQGLAVARLQTSIPTSAVESAARSSSSSPQSLFQAAYSIILSSYLGSSDVCFGTVFSGRTLPILGIEDIIGPCLTTLPIRVDTSMSRTLQDLVQDLNSTNRKHLEHSSVPLRDIKSAAGVNPRQQLFDSLLIWQQTLHSYEHQRKHVFLVDSVDNLEFNLTLEILPGTGNIELKANYQASVFPNSQVNLLLRQLERIAQLIVSYENTSLNDVFSQLEDDLLSIENPQPQTALGTETITSSVERIAAGDPQRPAIEFAHSISEGDIELESISYFELNSHANRMGQYLLQQGVLPDELVCICMEKCVGLYASILATAKVGAGYLPVAPDIPQDRLRHILSEANVEVILAESVSCPFLKSFPGVRVIYVDEVDLGNFPSNNFDSKSSPDHLSYCVFTSGSTGTPKGVLVTQGNLISNLEVLEELYPATKDARLLQSCSQAFDVSVFEIFFTWRIGGCLCSAVKDVLFRDIENAIRKLRVTHLSLTPTVAALVEPKNVPEVQFLVTAGEAVTQKVFNAWADRGLYQGYGPSETTNICTVNPKVSQYDSINNIGPPFKNTSAFVLSPGDEFSLVPRGGEGEFCFGGSQVFRGYIDKSQEIGKIIQHPKFGRLYRSGDFGRIMPDGSLSFTGRKDDQVKIRGQRVELGEINNVLLRSPEIGDCITMIITSNEASQKLVCFWTPHSATSDLECLTPEPILQSKLYKTLESALPSYMIPSALIPVSYLPATSQGKIDKRLLVKIYNGLDIRYLESTAYASSPSGDHEWTSLETDIVKCLAQVTAVPLEDIHPDTSFFSLGVDSISAISLSRTLRRITDRRVEISDILQHSSVVRLAEAISSDDQNNPRKRHFQELYDFGFDEDFKKSTIDMFAGAGRDLESILPCTPLQEAMLSAAQTSSEKMYRNQVVFDIVGDVDRLHNCWQEMARRHEILRTCFVSTDMPRYPYVQVVLKEYCPIFVDGTTRMDLDDPIDNIEDPASQREFDPPYNFDLVDRSGSTKLLFSMHHALYDGVALTVLYDEVEKLYHNHSLPPPVSFTPFLQVMVAKNPVESDMFWQKVLKKYTPTKFNNNLLGESRISRLPLRYPLSWVDAAVKRNNTTLLAVCHSVWASLMSELLQSSDICFGNVISGRTIPVDNIERLVAPCFNTVPSRLQDTHKLSFLEAFRRFQSFSVDSLPFQLTPLRRIQSKFSLDGSRLFYTLFILQQPSKDLDTSIWSISEDNGAMDFPLVCEVVPKSVPDVLEIVLHSHSSIISVQDAEKLIKSFQETLKLALDNPRRQLLSPSTKERIAMKATESEKTPPEVERSIGSKVMTEDEKKIRDIIASFTDVPLKNIGRDVSIFRLGLDSISAVQVATRLRKQGYSAMASDILENPSIAQISNYLSSSMNLVREAPQYDFAAFDQKHRLSICSKHNLQSDRILAIRPCTAVQNGMIAQSLHSDGDEYVNSLWLELSPEISVQAFKEAWTAVTNQHEILRTGFAQIEDQQHPFAMIVHSQENFSMPWSVAAKDPQWKTVAMDRLIQSPWSMSFQTEGGRIVAQFIAHHALYDAQSLQMIFSDVSQFYKSGNMRDRPPVTLLLGAILASGEVTTEHKEFWAQDENKIVINRFPDLTPLAHRTSKSFVHTISSKAFTSELEEACKDNGFTMQAVGQAAWARLLAAYTGETSTTFGMTLSGRSAHEDADNIAFPSIVTLPVRCDVSGTNEELVSRTMKSSASIHKHQFTPLTSIQRWADCPEGSIFDSLFAYQKVPEGLEDTEPLWKIIREAASVDYPVSLEIQPEKSGKLSLRLTFREDLIPIEQADLILKQYDALLLDTLHEPRNRCDLAPVIDPELLSITPAKEKLLPATAKLLHNFVEEGALKWPDKMALEFVTSFDLGQVQSRSWTYDQLNREGNKVANLLLHHVKQGQMVAICFDKCAEASFAITGILKAGCTYVALDPTAPMDRLNFIVKDSGAAIVLSAGKPAQNLFASLDSEIIALDTPDVLSGCSSDTPILNRDILPQNTAYCLYTSGTTGTPKGCLIRHESVVQFMLFFQRLFAGRWTQDSKWLQFASFHFDVSLVEQFWSWSVGICVTSAPRDLIFEDIPGAIRKLGITHIDLTPSLARLVHPDDVPSLWDGVFITGGEALRQEILDDWGEKGCIHNAYGPTEATIGVTTYPRVPKNGKPSNIGPQFDNVGSFVLKPGTELPVLRGGIGELCVSGVLVGEGYLNRPDLTAEKFPTLMGFNERVYRTGDLVRILFDGSFLFLGRADDQVKLRGQRLELSEINEVVKKSTDIIDEAVTLVLKHTTQQKEQLVTFFVCSAFDQPPPGRLILLMRDACKARLPGYMVPIHFIPIKGLPLNVNNKADSKQLAAIYNNLSVEELQKLSSSTEQNAVWTGKEQNVVVVLSRILNVEIPALTSGTNIFELGLDSISIIAFSRALQEAGFASAKLSIIKSNPNINALVQVLLNETSQGQVMDNAHVATTQDIAAFSQKHLIGICKELEIESTNIESIVSCTPVQEGMIYRFLESDHALYFNKFAFRLDPRIDQEKLVVAWNEVVKHLQILRTVFVATDDGYAQVVLRTCNPPWGSALTDYDSIAKSDALKLPYSLSLSSGNREILTLQMFHGLYDGNSLDLLLHCVVDEYHDLNNVEYGPSFHSALSHGPLAKTPGSKQFWTNHLRTWTYHHIPKRLDTSRTVNVTRTIRSLVGFEDLRRRLGVAPQAIIQAVWLSVLQTITSTSLTIGVVNSGRAIDFKDAEKVIGPLFNTVPFHISILPGMTSADLITKCHEFNMQMLDFQHTPLKDIQKCCHAQPGQSLFDSLFVFQRSESNDDYADGAWTQLDDSPIADYPLAFEATLNKDGTLSLLIVAQGSIITDTEAESLLSQVEVYLQSTLRESGANIVLDNGPTANFLQDQPTSTASEAKPKDLSWTPHFNDSSFVWTDAAELIRTEIGILAQISRDRILESSSIFELGLDSIDVIKLASRLKKQGVEIPVSAIIKCQTIAKMLPQILVRHGQSLQSDMPGKKIQEMRQNLQGYLQRIGKLPSNIEAVHPATPLQQTMVNEMIKSDYRRYFNVEAFRLGESVDPLMLMAAVGRVVEASPILRTSFIEVDDPRSPVSFAQIVKSNSPSFSGVTTEQDLEIFVDRFRDYSAELAATRGILFHVHFPIINTTNYMVMAISHALYDGRSLQIIHEDIQSAYREEYVMRPDFKPFLEDVFRSTTEDAKSFWRNTLSNLPRAMFPRKTVPSDASPSRIEAISQISPKDAEDFCKSQSITMQTLGQTCWAIVLSNLMGQLDVVFGSVLSCRDSEEANEVMFPLMNTLAVRSVLHGSIAEMLRYMQNMSDTTRQYQHFPLGTAQAYALASEEDPTGDTSLFDTLFIYQGRRAIPEAPPLYEAVYGTAEVEFLVCAEMEIVDDKLSWTVACKPVAGNSAETEEIISMLDDVLERILTSSESPTIVFDADGASVGGLPKFKTRNASRKEAPKSPKSIDSEWSDTEIIIRRALHELSDVPEDAIHKLSTIFHLGLDSILVLKLPALLKPKGINLRVSDILRDQTVHSMAMSVDRSTLVDQTESLDVEAIISTAVSSFDIPTDMGDVEFILPATAGQLYMIRMWQTSQGILFYPTFSYTLPGNLDKRRLEIAWKALFQQFEILRTGFRAGFVDGKPGILQIVFKDPPNVILYNTSAPREVSKIRTPPVKLVAEQADEGVTRLKLTIHHALYDGVSLPILFNELQALYQGQSTTATGMNLRTFVAQSLTASTKSTSGTSTREKWTAYLKEETLWPVPTTNDSLSCPFQRRTEVFLQSRNVPPLKQLAQESGVSIDALLLASTAKIYAQSLPASTSRSHVVFGIYLANRAPYGEDLSSLAAPTLNLLPMSVQNPLLRGISEIAKEIQHDLHEISRAEMSCASLEKIHEWTGVRVNFFVNIHKDGTAAIKETGGILGQSEALSKAEVVEESPNSSISIPTDGTCDAYLPAVDLEMRYQNGKLDIGVFAPNDMISVSEAESMIERFTEILA